MSRKETQGGIHHEPSESSSLLDTGFSFDLAIEDGLLEPGDYSEEKVLSQKELDLLAVQREGYTAVDWLVDQDNHHRLSGWYEAGIKLVHDIHVINRNSYDSDEGKKGQKGLPEKIKGGLKKVPGVKRFVRGIEEEPEEVIFENNGNGHMPGK